MKIQIKSIYGSIKFEGDFSSLKEAVLAALKNNLVNLCSADLCGADLRGAKNGEFAIAQTRILSDGDLIGWKKCKDSILVKLLIPSNAKRSHSFGRKCRAEFEKVLEIFGAKEAVSLYDNSFIYRTGETVKPKEKFSLDWQDECASGIHFFITKIEAEKYIP